MSTFEAFMGRSYAAFLGSDQYSQQEFTFDENAGMNDPHVKMYYEMRLLSTERAQRDKLRTFMAATENALRERLSSGMTDKDAQDVVDIIGRMRLVLGAGYPDDMEPEVKTAMATINDLSKQLQELRKKKMSELNSGSDTSNGETLTAPEKTTMEKVGPVLALAAGGIAAYLALR